MIARLVLLLLLALISATLAAAANGAYPGKNGKIAFVRGAWIYTIDTSGKNAQRLVRGGGPAWSPDGAQIAFHRDAGVFVMNADGKSVRQLTSEYENSPTWSPDGKRLIVVGGTEPENADCTPTAPYSILWSIGVDGSDRVLFTPLSVADEICSVPGGDDWPDWSPRGDRVAFGHDELVVHDTYDESVLLARADGKQRKTVYTGAQSPSWSPDGKRLAWVGQYKGNLEIWVGDPDQGSKQRLTKSGGGNYGPAWSPDGTKLVFSRQKGSPTGLVVLDLARGTLTRLTTSVGDGAPTWQPLP